jgi:thiol-disulfide isomerase/thioredoxin
MKKQLKWLLPAIGLVVLLLAAGAIYRSLSSRYTPPAPSVTQTQPDDGGADPTAAPAEMPDDGDVDRTTAAPANVPEFTVLDADGAENRLSDHRGKPVVINFWATWCPYCIEELPMFDEAAKTYGDRIDFMIVDCVDAYRETERNAKAYLEENGLTFPAYFDTMGEASALFGASSIPLTVFIHPDGTVMDSYLGAMQQETLQSYLDALVA